MDCDLATKSPPMPVKRMEVSHSHNDKAPAVKVPTLKVMTYNIWNDSIYFQERMSAIIRNIKNRAPDIICLLDVSVEAYQILEQLENFYHMFQVFTVEGETSGTVLLCNKKTIGFPEDTSPYYYDYPQGGRIVGAEIYHLETNYSFHVLGTRLDDHPDNDNIRETQCDVIYNVVRKMEHFILMGDMNFYNRCERGEVKLTETMSDTWIKLQCPSELRFTYNGKANPIIRNNEKLRNARIYYRAKTKKATQVKLHPRAMALICTGNISDDIKIPPSPYYGLEAIYEIKA